MNQMLILAVNSSDLGGLLFLLSAGFSLIFGLMRIPNLVHGSLFMLGAYVGSTFVFRFHFDFWFAAVFSALVVAAFGGVVERLLLRRLAGNHLAQVLVTLGVAFMIADFCLMVWGGDPVTLPSPKPFTGLIRAGALAFPTYRLIIIVIACVF